MLLPILHLLQADTPDSVRPSQMVPATTERLLAGFTLNTPVDGLRQRVREGPLR